MVRHRRDDHKRLTFNIPEQEHILNTHIDTLAEWWSEAEHAPFREGDALIARFDDRPMPFEVYPAGCDSDVPAENVRILARAPKPEPAWHDAVAVLANHRDYADERRTVWVQIGDGEHDRVNIEGDTAAEHHLVNVTPLIEAKVTDEMIERGQHIGVKGRKPDAELVRRVLTAALGLEAE